MKTKTKKSLAMERRKLASTSAPKYDCQGCGFSWTETQLEPVPFDGLFERVQPGEPMPAGECPDCGALCHEREVAEPAPKATATESISIKDIGLEWLECAPVTWDAKVTASLEKGTSTVQELENWLDSIAERAARLSGYLDARGATGCGDNGHAEGVLSSNRKVAKVRKALGFSYPKTDLSF